jgi:hypothetical protein
MIAATEAATTAAAAVAMASLVRSRLRPTGLPVSFMRTFHGAVGFMGALP